MKPWGLEQLSQGVSIEISLGMYQETLKTSKSGGLRRPQKLGGSACLQSRASLYLVQSVSFDESLYYVLSSLYMYMRSYCTIQEKIRIAILGRCTPQNQPQHCTMAPASAPCRSNHTVHWKSVSASTQPLHQSSRTLIQRRQHGSIPARCQLSLLLHQIPALGRADRRHSVRSCPSAQPHCTQQVSCQHLTKAEHKAKMSF